MIKKTHFLYLSLLGIVMILIWKGLPFFQEPRLWAEEGTIYLKSAFEEGCRAMFLPQQGYYAIIPSVATYMTSLLPIVYIPAFTQYISLLFWILLFTLIIGINRKEYSVGVKISFAFSILFIVLSQYEIFLNTINLQFITPIIFIVTLLYDEGRLAAYQRIGLRVLQIICLLNGVLILLLMPFLLYKALFLQKKYDLVFIYLMSIMLHIGLMMSYEGKNSMMWRIEGNWDLLVKDWNVSFLQVVEHRPTYMMLIGLGIITLFIFKRWSIENGLFLASVGGLILFIDFTKLPHFMILSRYLVIIYALLYLIFVINIPKDRWYGVGSLMLIMIVLYHIFKEEIKLDAYCYHCPKWSEEYPKINSESGANVHPSEEWVIKLKKK